MQHAQHPADRHDERERDRQDPDCRRAELRAPDPDGHHCDQMVDARDRMQQAADEAARHASLLVRESRLRQCERDDRGREGSGDM